MEPTAEPQSSAVSKLDARVRGLIVLAGGLALGWWQVWIPLHAAQDGRETVTVYAAFVGLAVAFTFLGALLVVFGSGVDRRLGALKVDPQNLDLKGVVVVLLVALPGVATWLWIMSQLSAQGYR